MWQHIQTANFFYFTHILKFSCKRSQLKKNQIIDNIIIYNIVKRLGKNTFLWPFLWCRINHWLSHQIFCLSTCHHEISENVCKFAWNISQVLFFDSFLVLCTKPKKGLQKYHKYQSNVNGKTNLCLAPIIYASSTWFDKAVRYIKVVFFVFSQSLTNSGPI